MAPRTSQQFEEIRQERRAEILDAALHLFAEEGYDRASVSKLASRAGISKGLMYNYFSSKEEVLKTIVVEMFREVMDRMGFHGDPEITHEQFVRFVEVGMDMALENPQRWKLYMNLTLQPGVLQVFLAELMPAMQPWLVSMTKYFVDKGYEDPVAVMRIFTAMVDGIQLHIIMDPKGFPIERAKKIIIEQFA